MAVIQRKEGMAGKSAFEVRLLPLKRFALISTICLLIWSGFLETSFFFSGFESMLKNPIPAWMLTVLLVLILEGSKFFFGAFTFRFLVRGWLKEGWHYWLAFLLVLPLCVMVFSGSIYLSIKGAPEVVVFFTRETQPPELENLDNINQYFNERISKLEREKEQVLTIRQRGRVTYHATLLLTKLQDQANSVELQRDSALNRAHRKNVMALAQTNQDIQAWGTCFSSFQEIAP